MKCYVKKTNKVISIILLLCIFFNSFSGFALTNIDYFDSDLELSPHSVALKSLTEQLNHKGLDLYSFDYEDMAISPSGYDFAARVTYEISEPIIVDEEETTTITFKLNSPSNKDISFDYKIHPGSALLYTHYTGIENGNIVFKAGETEKSINVTISAINNSYDEENPRLSDAGSLWSKDRVFYINCYNINNALFENHKKVMTIPIRIENALELKEIYERASNVFMSDMSTIQNAKEIPDTPGKYINLSETINIATSSAITADVRKIIDTGTFTHLNLPTGYFLNESDETGEVGLQIFRNESNFPILDRRTTINDENKIDFSFGDASLLDLMMGPHYETNGVVKSLGVSLNYYIMNDDVFTLFHDEHGNYIQYQMNFEDKIHPFPINSTAPSGEYCLGESIPITVSFNEAVLVDNISIIANDTVLYPIERKGTISESVSFLYEVGLEFNGLIIIDEVTGAVDLSGKSQDENTSHVNHISDATLKSYTLEELLAYCAKTEIVVNQGKSLNAEVEINISLKENDELSEYLGRYKEEDGRISIIKAKVIGENGNIIDVDLYANSGLFITILKGKFIAPASSLLSNTNYIAEIYFNEEETNEFNLIYSLSKQYTLPQIIYIDDESDLEIIYENWPVDNKIPSNSTNVISLKYEVKNNATWQESEDFVWESSDNTIASITSSGAISLTGKPGNVQFSLTALNSGEITEKFTIHSNTLQVIDTSELFLNISSWSKSIEAVKGNNVKVYYSTNITANNEEATIFNYNLYEAKYESGEIITGDLIFSDTKSYTAETQELYYEIDNKHLSMLSEKGKYSYILEISAIESATNTVFTSSAYIRVKALPAKAVLQKPDSYYITDDISNIYVKFNINNNNPSTELLFTVTKNNNTIITSNDLSDIAENIQVTIEDVPDSRLFDTYVVSLQAKNQYDEAYSYDSYIMYVYNADALKISINGVNKETHTMSLDNVLKEMSSQEILNLNRNIALLDNININTEYKWNSLFDKTTWSVDDENILSLKYKDGGMLSNMNNVAPGTQLLLEGLSPGESSLTVTHNLTGMEEKINVAVDDLREKLFIFQVYPAQKSEIVYYNGNNQFKVVETDKDGRIAIFESSGIKSDVTFRPENSAVYDIFILNNNELKSMQQSSSNNDLYPQNNIAFKKSIYETSFYVRLIDSKGRMIIYKDDVIIKGGVYRNGVYCPNATINGNIGKEEQIVGITGYQYLLKFNPEEFVNDKYSGPITPNDKIEYVFEVIIPGSMYYSDFIKVDHDTIQLYKKDYNFKFPVPVGMALLESKSKSEIENHINIFSQLVLGENTMNVPEVVIIEDLSKTAYITTDIALKGNPLSKYNVKLIDRKNNVIVDPASTEIESYEFSDTILIKNTFNVQQYVSNLNFGEISNLGIQVTIEDANKLEIINLSSQYNVSRINGIREISSLETKALQNIRTDVRNSIGGPSMINSSNHDDYIQTALSYLSGFKLDSDKIRLEITPTDNPLVFKGVIMMGVGQMSKYMKSGVYSRDEKASALYNYMPDYEVYNSDFINNSRIYMNAYMGGYGSNSKSYGGGAYFDCEIVYDIDAGEWKIVVLKSFMHIGGGYHYQKIYNTWIGPVPVTAEFLAGGTGQLNLITSSDKDKASTYITDFQPYIYVRGFGGVGRDYKIASLKAGVYGKVSLDQQYLWLKSPQKNSSGQRLTLAGETGIEYEIKLVLANVEGTYEIDSGSKTWTFNDYNNIKKQYEFLKSRSLDLDFDELDDEQITIEGRSYLAKERSWNSYMARKSSLSGTNIVQTNSYPYSNPVLSTDKEMMVYISDMNSYDINETSLCFSVKSGGVFPVGTPIDNSIYADIDGVIDGNAGNAAVAWTRVITDMELKEGSVATKEDLQTMISSTEIMASIYDGSKFHTTRLTDNSTADMSPVVATNKEKTIVAWRSLSAGDIDNPLSFDSRDNIMYRIYDGTSWSDEKCLYDGSIDKISTLNIKMLSNGISAVTYNVTVNDTGNTEVYCVIIDAKGNILKNIRLSNNMQRDENPQITSVLFPDKAECFVIGWNSFKEEADNAVISMIEILAIDENGNIYSHFNTETEDSNSNYSNFKFTKGSETIEDLSIVWIQPEFDSEDNENHAIWGRKLLLEDESFIFSPKIKLLELDQNILIDFFDAHVDNTGKISYMLQTTDYNDDESSNIIYGQSEYLNKLSLEQVYYSRDELFPENKMPIMFRLYNRGIEPIKNVSITFEDTVHEYKDVNIAPGQYKDINVFYTVPETIVDTTYLINAEYPSLSTDTITGSIKLNIPDIGIDSIGVIKESERERLFNIMLYNNSYSKLIGGKHTVKLYVYDSSDIEAAPIATEIISDESSLNIINNGMLNLNILLSEGMLQSMLSENGEIPDDGVQLFFKVAIEEDGEEIEDSDLTNGWSYAKVRGLISKNMEDISISSKMNSNSKETSVQVDITNNSMNELAGGKILVKLKNEDGKVIQTKQFGENNSLIIGGEETFSTTFSFNTAGTSYDALYIPDGEDSGEDDSENPGENEGSQDDYSDHKKNKNPKDENKPTNSIFSFKDVKDTDWFYEAVKFVLKNGLMVGTSNETFEPELLVTRGMLVTILHRLENQPSASNSNFIDVMPEDYYYKAVTWAHENNIVLGINETIFDPNESISREQFATILYRYYLYKNNGAIDIEADLSEFEDKDMISEYALTALQWAVGKGLIKGRDENTLVPKGNTTRAETAVILQRFIGGSI